MDVELQINNSASPAARFVTWAPSPCRIRVTNPSGVSTPTVSIGITATSAAGLTDQIRTAAITYAGRHRRAGSAQSDRLSEGDRAH